MPKFQIRRCPGLKSGLSKDAFVTPSSLDDDDGDNDDDDSVGLQDLNNRKRIKKFCAIHPPADENKVSMHP